MSTAFAPTGATAHHGGGSVRAAWASVRRHPLAALYVLALIPLLLLGARQPVFSLVDESAHYDYIAQLAHGTVPIRGTPIRSETLSVMQQTGVYRAYLDIPQPQASTRFLLPARDAPSAAWALWSARHQWQWSSEAATPPLYYVASVPAWWLGDMAAGPVGAVAALRIENALLAALLAPLLYLLVLELIAPSRRDVAAWIALLAVSLPGIVMSLTSTTNNTLVTVASTALLLVCMRSLRRGWTRRGLFVVGGLAAVAVATKSIAPGIAPAVLISLVWGVRADGIAAVGRRTILVGAIAAIGLLPLIVLNHGGFGLLSVSTAAPLTPADPGVLPLTFGAVISSVDNAVLTFALGEPLGVTLPPATALAILVAACALAVLSVAVLMRISGGPSPADVGARWIRRSQMAVLSVAVAGQLGLSVVQLLLSHGVFAVPAPGRYVYPALGGVIGLFALALVRAKINPRTLRVGGLLIISVSAATLTLYPNRLTSAVQLEGSGQPVNVAQAVAVQGASADVNGFTVQVDSVVRERDAQWVHVTASNTGNTAAEWLPMANGTAGGITVAVTDYHHSSSIPEQVLPGQSASGWLSLQSPPGTVLPARFTLTFPDVATDSYRDVRSFEIAVALS